MSIDSAMISEVYVPNIWRQGQSGVGTSEYSALTTLQRYPVQLNPQKGTLQNSSDNNPSSSEMGA